MTIEVDDTFPLVILCEAKNLGPGFGVGCNNAATCNLRILHKETKKYITINVCDTHKDQEIAQASKYLEENSDDDDDDDVIKK